VSRLKGLARGGCRWNRLDYTKAFLAKLLAFEALLDAHAGAESARSRYDHLCAGCAGE